VTLTNSGASSVQITQIGLTGAGFAASGIATPLTLQAGQSAVLQASFVPTTAGAVTGGITVLSDATVGTSTIALSGTGVAANYTMSLSPATVSFGNVNAGSSATQSVKLSNSGNANLTVTQLAASGTGISVSGLTTPLLLTPLQSATFTVTYAPTAGGATTGGITVTNNDGVSTVAAVTGTAIQAGLSVTPTSANFTSVITGNTSSQTIQLKNSGTANLTISQAAVSGSGFSASGLTFPLTLTPGQSGSLAVQYAPQVAGNASG